MLLLLCLSLCLTGSIGAQLLHNAGFENHNYNGNWHCYGCTLSSSTDSYHGSSSIKVTNRQHNWSGLGQTVTVQPGHTYIFTAHMKLLSNSHGHMYDSIELMLSLTHDNGRVSYTLGAKIPYVQKAFGWFEIGYDFHVPGDVHKIDTYIQIPDTSVNYLVDTASLNELQHDNNWKTEANQRINNLRKAPITVQYNKLKANLHLEPAWDASAIVDNNHQKYQEFFYDNFEYAVLENSLKWRLMEWTQGHPNLDKPMRAVTAMRNRGIIVRGHNMFWAVPGHEPSWIDHMSKSQTLQAMHKHVNDVISRTRGTLVHWDVNNENLHGDFFEQHTGHANITMEMFNWIHQLEPNVKLFLNEYNVASSSQMTTAGDSGILLEINGKFTIRKSKWSRLSYSLVESVPLDTEVRAYKGQAERMHKSGSPIYGVGVQCHTNSHQDMTTVKYRLDKIAEAGLPMWITELTVDEADENRRANALEDLLTLFMSHPAVEGVLLWGFWDGQIWIKTSALANGSGVTPNAAGRRYQQLYKQTWRTHTTTQFTNNQIHLNGFMGDYVLRVKNGGHVVQTHNFTLAKSGSQIDINF